MVSTRAELARAWRFLSKVQRSPYAPFLDNIFHYCFLKYSLQSSLNVNVETRELLPGSVSLQNQSSFFGNPSVIHYANFHPIVPKYLLKYIQ